MSYQKQAFMDYLRSHNNGNPGAYSNGLDNIEKLLNVDIDAEYLVDRCKGISSQIQKMRQDPRNAGKMENNLRQYSSRLNKYVEFCGQQGIRYHETEEYEPGLNEDFMDSVTDVGLNTILYGPPGTGKTYHTVIYAVAIVENKELASIAQEEYAAVLERYNEYKAQGRIEFTTFHQSYGYEEFIEGIRPTIIDEGDETNFGNIQYSVQAGVFKKFCEKAERPAAVQSSTSSLGINENATFWKVSLWSTGDNEVRSECLKNGHIRIGWDQYGKDITDETDFSVDGGRVVLNAFMNKMQVGDIVLSCYSASTIDAIGVVTGEYEWHDEYHELKRLRKVKWIVKNIRENILAMNGGTTMTLASVYRLSNIAIADVYKLIEKHQPAPFAPSNRKENYVFIIDEINRGNMSKIFGELLMLIEKDYRGTKATLAYSGMPFSVPENLYIIGMMNTADRSLAMIDYALRRRFSFFEMEPGFNSDGFTNYQKAFDNETFDALIDQIKQLNKEITEDKSLGRGFQIGHSYFCGRETAGCSDEWMRSVVEFDILPMLSEYWFDEPTKLQRWEKNLRGVFDD
jgi:5-methylcytosine-specific restriction protein B